jgi:hypothetical protein
MNFEDCSAFTLITACTLAESPSDPLSKAPAASLPPLLLRLLPGGANQFPGGTQLPLDISAFARRTRTISLIRIPPTILNSGDLAEIHVLNPHQELIVRPKETMSEHPSAVHRRRYYGNQRNQR